MDQTSEIKDPPALSLNHSLSCLAPPPAINLSLFTARICSLSLDLSVHRQWTELAAVTEVEKK